MKTLKIVSLTCALLLSAVVSASPQATNSDAPNPHFAPFEQWKAAILAGDSSTLTSLYSTDPPAKVRINLVAHDASADVNFWLGLKPRSIQTEVVRNEPRHGHISYIFRAQVQPASGPVINLTEDQSWLQEGDRWRVIDVERTDSPHLAQPANMKKDLYPADVDAHLEIKEAEAKAGKENKRVLLVFGANWCFDCHVLDLAFHGPALSPIVDANYEVVHVDIGPDGKKNGDLAEQFEVPLNKGVPAMAVIDADGKLLASDKNGEVEDARGLTPEYLADFLNKWKPQR